MTDAYHILGTPRAGNILIVGDHASNHVPDGIDLGIDPKYLVDHIAWDIGVAGVAAMLVERQGFAAILGAVSRLTVDLNRDRDDVSVIPQCSDGIVILANDPAICDRAARLIRFFDPYHAKLACLIAQHRPALILSLHSFTPRLAGRPHEQRPWQIGVLYNEDDRAAHMAMPLLSDAGFIVGDQQPYSGKLLNATMNRHAEANDIAYLGIEMRQDLVADSAGQERFANILDQICHIITEKLASDGPN